MTHIAKLARSTTQSFGNNKTRAFCLSSRRNLRWRMFQSYYDTYDARMRAKNAPVRMLSALQARRVQEQTMTCDGFHRISLCRKALEALDRRGWQRSYHQKMFHDTFMRACARVFWKTEKPGQFARDHQKILQFNGWDNLSQEILVSTPRRSEGKVGRRVRQSPQYPRW